MNSKFSKILWTINGIGILIVLIIIGYNQISSLIEKMESDEFETGILVGSNENQKFKLDSLKFDLQHIVFTRPDKIKYTDLYLTEITILDKKMPNEIKEALKEAAQLDEKMFGATINVLFFKEDRSEVYTLLKKSAYIDLISYPGTLWRWDYMMPKEQLEKMPFILFKIAMNDDNGDNRINYKDNMAFYLSDLYGKNIERITPDTIKIDYFWFTDNFEEIYFESFKEVEISEDLPYYIKERDLYYYNIKRKIFAKVDQIEKEIKRIQNEYSN